MIIMFTLPVLNNSKNQKRGYILIFQYSLSLSLNKHLIIIFKSRAAICLILINANFYAKLMKLIIHDNGNIITEMK